MDFTILADQRIKLKESETKDKYFDFAGELKKKAMEQEGDNYTNCDWCFRHSHQRLINGTGELGVMRMIGDHPNNNTIENGQNTEKRHGNLRRLAVIQTPEKDHQLKLI